MGAQRVAFLGLGIMGGGMARLNSPMAEYFAPADVEVGNKLFWYIFKGVPVAKDSFIDLDDNRSGLGLTVDEKALKKFHVIERPRRAEC